MNTRVISGIIFVLGLICLITDLNLFYNCAIFVDEFNTSPDVVYGGEFWLLMEWATFGFLAIIVLLSGINLVKFKNLNKK